MVTAIFKMTPGCTKIAENCQAIPSEDQPSAKLSKCPNRQAKLSFKVSFKYRIIYQVSVLYCINLKGTQP